MTIESTSCWLIVSFVNRVVFLVDGREYLDDEVDVEAVVVSVVVSAAAAVPSVAVEGDAELLWLPSFRACGAE